MRLHLPASTRRTIFLAKTCQKIVADTQLSSRMGFETNPADLADALKICAQSDWCYNHVPPFPEGRGRDDSAKMLHLFGNVPPFPSDCTMFW